MRHAEKKTLILGPVGFCPVVPPLPISWDHWSCPVKAKQDQCLQFLLYRMFFKKPNSHFVVCWQTCFTWYCISSSEKLYKVATCCNISIMVPERKFLFSISGNFPANQMTCQAHARRRQIIRCKTSPVFRAVVLSLRYP